MASTSTKTYPMRTNMVRGMNRAVKPTLLTDQWRTLFNVRPFFTRLNQVPRKRVFGNFCSEDPSDVQVLSTFPTGIADEAGVVALTRSGAFRINTGTGIRLLTSVGLLSTFDYSGVYERWSHCHYDNNLFFVNTHNSAAYTNGTDVVKLSNAPRGRYIEHYFDHLIVGSPVVDGVEQRFSISWSHKDGFNEWTSKTFTEADEFDFHENRHGGEAVLNGVTGVKRLNDLLLIHTPSCVYSAQYVGIRQGVFKFAPAFQNTGCGFPYGLVSIGSAHLYPDLSRKTFFMLSAEGAKEIGAPVMDYLREELSPNPEFAFRLYGYVDFDYREVHWVFCSYRSNGEYDREVVYNFDNDTWYVGSVENVQSFCPATRLAKTAEELTGEAEALTGSCERLSRTRFVIPRLFGTKLNFVLAEETVDDAVTDLLEQPLPLLETGDFVYDDIARIKEVESMAIQAGYSTGSGLKVYYSARDTFDETVAWTLAGTWTPDLVETVLSAPRAAGRIWRFMFVPATSGAGTEVALNPQTRCAELASTFEFYTQRRTTFEFLCNESENYAGYWYQFFPANNVDYKWRLRFVLPENRTLTRIEIYRINTAGGWTGQAWATDLFINALGNRPYFATFPVVIFEDGVQKWDEYQASLGVIEAGEHEWIMYGDKFTNPYSGEWFYLKLVWADATEQYITSAECVSDRPGTDTAPTPSPTPPLFPPTPSPCVANLITASNLAVSVDGDPTCPCYTINLVNQVVLSNGGMLTGFNKLDGPGGTPDYGYGVGAGLGGSEICLNNPGTYYFRAYAVTSTGCTDYADFSVTLECVGDVCDLVYPSQLLCSISGIFGTQVGPVGTAEGVVVPGYTCALTKSVVNGKARYTGSAHLSVAPGFMGVQERDVTIVMQKDNVLAVDYWYVTITTTAATPPTSCVIMQGTGPFAEPSPACSLPPYSVAIAIDDITGQGCGGGGAFVPYII